MSALGQTATYASQQKAPLFDHLVGAELDRRRQLDADRLGGLEVDDQLEFGGLLNWKIGRFRTVEYFDHVKSELTINGRGIYSIGNQSAGLGVGLKDEHGGEPLLDRQLRDVRAG